MGYFAFGGAGNIPESYIGLYACGLATVLGHIFPVYYRFKGGKAAATACGVFLVAQPVIALCAFVLCVGLAFVIKYVSPMSLVFMLINVVWQCLFMPEFTFAPLTDPILILLVVALGVAVYAAHWQNIVRLVQGKERKTDLWAKITEKIGKKKSNDIDQPQIADADDTGESVEKDKPESKDENSPEEVLKNTDKNIEK